MIYAGTKGYLDDLDAGDVRRFENELLDYMRSRHTVLRKELFAQRRELLLWTTWGVLLAAVLGELGRAQPIGPGSRAAARIASSSSARTGGGRAWSSTARGTSPVMRPAQPRRGLRPARFHP